MYVVTKRPGESAKLVEIATTTVPEDAIKDALDQAWFTVAPIRIDGENIDIWCDDEGLLKRLPFNFWHPELHQAIVGPIIACAHDAEGESIPLTKKQAEAVISWLDL